MLNMGLLETDGRCGSTLTTALFSLLKNGKADAAWLFQLVVSIMLFFSIDRGRLSPQRWMHSPCTWDHRSGGTRPV